MQKKNATSIEDTYSPSASFGVLKMFLNDAARHKCRSYQFGFIEASLQAQMRIIVFIKLPTHLLRGIPIIWSILWKTCHAQESNV
jgi:hypothetical protein